MYVLCIKVEGLTTRIFVGMGLFQLEGAAR
jgi:hypothetical protein